MAQHDGTPPRGKTDLAPQVTPQSQSGCSDHDLGAWAPIGSVANDYVNHEIHNRAGQNVGTIKDMLKGPDGNMAAAVINVGRFLGIGDKDVAVPFSALLVELQDNQRRIVLNVAEDELKAAPAFERRKTSP